MAEDQTRTLLFIRGFQGINNVSASSTSQSKWFRALRSFGYRGRILSFRWCSPWWDCLSASARSARVNEATDALFDFMLRSDRTETTSFSVLGFSMGGTILQRALRKALRHGVQVRRAYLFGAAAPRASRWPELLDAVSDRLWNFHASSDDILARYAPDSVGLYGLPSCHPKARDVNCESLVSDHEDWRHNVQACLRRANLNPKHL